MSALALQSFGFEGQTVRALDQDGMPWFVAQDVCACLEIGNHRDAVGRLDDDERDGVGIADAMGRMQEQIIISESGMYALIFRSRKPAAVRFRKWVTGEVLPALRRTGHYEIAVANDGAGVLASPDAVERVKVALSVVREARVIYGRKGAADLWAKLGLPDPGLGTDIKFPKGYQVPMSVNLWSQARLRRSAPDTRIKVSVLHSDFEEWCKREGDYSLSLSGFGKALARLGFSTVMSNGSWLLGYTLAD